MSGRRVYSNIKLKTNKIKETKTNKIEANNDIREREENGSIYKRERVGGAQQAIFSQQIFKSD